MKIEKISLKALTVGILLLLGLSSIALTLFSSMRYQDAALAAQADSLARIIDVAHREAQRALHTRLDEFADRLPRARLTAALAAAGEDAARRDELVALLNAPFQRTDNSGLDLARLRVYDAQLQRVAESSAGVSGLPAELPAAFQQRIGKSGAPTRPLASYWAAGAAVYYSQLLPLGGEQPAGYLELVVSPLPQLQVIQDGLKLPFRIHLGDHGPDEISLYESDDWRAPDATELSVHHEVQDLAGNYVMDLEVTENVAGLYGDMAKVRGATAVAFLLMTGGSLILAIGLFNAFLFRPVGHLIQDMQRAAEGELNVSVRSRALKEFNALAKAFDRMTGKVHELVERERQHAEDVTGKVELIQEVVESAAHGDLTGQLMIYRDNDVISELAAGIQGMLDSLNSLVARIQQSGIQVTSSATEIAATAKQQEATVSEQAATTNEIRATVTQISATSKELVNTMHEVTDVALKTAESANHGRTSLVRMEETMRNMMEATAAIGSKLAVLSEKAGNINTVVTTINKVSDQTNLLSLNAAIEAEKAGEYGVGFAVVATEIRRLADQTAVATWDIEQMVKEMQSAVSAGVMGMEKFSTEVRQGVDDVRRVGAQLAHIIEQVEHLIPRFEEVHEGMQSQAKGAHQISEAMVQLAESSQQTAESLRQSNGAIGQLNDAARRLQEGVSHFKVNG